MTFTNLGQQYDNEVFNPLKFKFAMFKKVFLYSFREIK